MGFSTTRHSDSFAGALNEARACDTTAGGTALNTTAKRIILPNGTTHFVAIARNFTTAVVCKLALNPYLLLLKTTDQLATQPNLTDYSAAGQNNPAGSGVVLNAFDVLANGNALYIGSHVPFGGVDVTMSASVNTVASVLSVKYWNGSWTSVSGFTDNTVSAGKTFGTSGTVVWTTPTDWAKVALNQTAAPVGPVLLYSDKPRYWTQWSVSVQFSATVKANTMIAINRIGQLAVTPAYAQLVQDSQVSGRTFKGPDGLAAIEALVDAGSGSLIVNAYTDNPVGAF